MFQLAHDQGGLPLSIEVVVGIGLAIVAMRCHGRSDAIRLACAAITVLVMALPPAHRALGRSVTAHMVQHLLIVIVVAPLVGFVLANAPSRHRSSAIARRISQRAVAPAAAPLVAGAVHAAVICNWHLPALYDAAVRSPIVHSVEHFTMLASGAWWWWTVAHHVRRDRLVAAVSSMFGVITAGAVLGVVMMFAPHALYEQGGVDDQRTAGAIMSGATGVLYGAVALFVVARAVERLEQPRRRRVPLSRGLPAVPIGVAIAGGLWSLGEPAPSETPASSSGTEQSAAGVDVDVGRELYRRDCAACHAPDGGGTSRAPSIVDSGSAGVYYAVNTGRMPIRRPDDVVRRGPPAYDDGEITAIVAYTATFLDGPVAPTVDIESADIARGGETFRRHCASCHGAEGIGGAQAFRPPAPAVLHAEPPEVVAAMLAGPGDMPGFSTVFDDDEMADVAAYVEVLKDPPSRGIVVFGGRVGEGLVAWLVAIGVLLIAVRWIGRTT